MKEETYLSNIDKNFLLIILEQRWQNLRTRYQILTTALFTLMVGFIIGYIKGEINFTNLNDVYFIIAYSLIGFIGITYIFDEYFKRLENKILNIGEMRNVNSN